MDQPRSPRKQTEDQMTRTGHCLCKAISWQTDAPDIWAGHCHCDSCRRACSAPMTSFFGVPRDAVIWHGKMSIYRSSEKVRRGFCPACGSQMFYETEDLPQETHLYAASLDGPAAYHPTAHYHWDERLPWLHVSDDLEKRSAQADAG
jgi:hypothetical protein